MPNALCYDNLVVLQNEIASDRVDLIYFDAGGQLQATYNVLLRFPAGDLISRAGPPTPPA